MSAIGSSGTAIQPQRFLQPMVFVRETSSRFLGIFPTTKATTSVYIPINGRVSVLPKDGDKAVFCHLPSGKVAEGVIKTYDLATKAIPLIGQEQQAKKNRVNVTFTTNTWSVASNFSAIFRNILWILNPINPDPGGVNGLGYTSAVGAITGTLQVVGSIRNLRSSQKIGDIAGARLAQMRMARGGVDGGAGLAAAGMRTMSLVGLKSTAQTVVTAGTIFSYVASSLWSLSLGMQTVLFAKNTIQSAGVLQGIKSIKDLLVKWVLSEEDIQAGKSAVKFTSAAELYDMISDPIVLTKEEEDILTVQEKESACEVIEKNMKGLKKENYPEIQDWTQVKDHLTVRYMKELARIKMVKEAEFVRVIGPDSLKAIKAAVKDGTIDFKAAEIVKTAREETYFKVFFNGLLLFAGVIGIASYITTAALTGGPVLVAGYAVMLLMNFIMSGADVYSLFKDFKTLEATSLKDILTLALFAIITIATVATGAFFATSGVMLIMILVIGALMLAIQAGTMIYAIHKYEKNAPLLSNPLAPGPFVAL